MLRRRFQPSRLVGIDLMPEQVARARARHGASRRIGRPRLDCRLLRIARMSNKKKAAKDTHVRGTIVAQNFSPKGHIEGVLVELGDGTGIVQLNLPKHAAPDADAKLA